MKKISLFIALLAFIGFSAHAQKSAQSTSTKTKTDKSSGTKASDKNAKTPAPEANPSNVTEFNVGGIDVILKPSTNDVISARLFYQGGTANYDKAHEGVEALALSIATDGGTKNYSKDDFHTAMESMGTSIASATNYDYSQISMKCVHQKWDKSWDLFADAIMNPLFSEDEFNIMKDQAIAGAKNTEADPDNMLRRMSIQTTFAGTNYEKVPDGTEASLGTLTLDDVKNQFAKISQKARMVLVIVGKIDQSDIEAKINNSLAKLPTGTYTKVDMKELAIPQSKIDYDQRDIATNYMRGLFPAPLPGTKEATAMRVAMSIISDRLFIEIRTKRNLSYAPGANMSPLADPYCILYVSTKDPNQSADVMMTELAKIRKNGFDSTELVDAKSKFLTQYYMRNETNDAQSEMLGEAQIISGDWHASENFNTDVKSVTLPEINAVINKYAEHIKWTYIGDKKVVDEKTFLRPISDIKVEDEKPKDKVR